ncbi:HAD family hydrolase [Kitasatospora sp. NPDC056138]|uniref:HAD family hydrolase n=1 Tax=Kitasatospora sp. NPDC056138 TaxID=3345724 RepID=UPI0035E2DD80
MLGEERDRGQEGDISSAHQALYARFWPGLRAFAGAADLLRAVAALGWTVVLASSASGRDLQMMRRILDADDAVTTATSADDVEAGKPAPDLVRAALDKAGARAEEAVFIGDTVWDVQSAATAGVPCIAVLSGGWSELNLRAAGAVEVREDAATLLTGLAHSSLGHPPTERAA